MDPIIRLAIASAGVHLGAVMQALYDGVAFRKDGKTYEIFSHEGDELGTISTADLNFATNCMRRMGREVGKLKHHQWDPVAKKFSVEYEPAFTFAWVGWHPIDGGR
jgi:hypothetical protein